MLDDVSLADPDVQAVIAVWPDAQLLDVIEREEAAHA